MKNLANCKPTEFLAQTIKIKNYAENWLSLTKIMEIRKRQPVPIGDEKPEDTQKRRVEQAKKNLSDMFNSIFDEHPTETLGLMALCCFVEPENVDDHPVAEYFGALNELLNSEEVISFFTSLVRLVLKNTSNMRAR